MQFIIFIKKVTFIPYNYIIQYILILMKLKNIIYKKNIK